MLVLNQSNRLIADLKTLRLFHWVWDIKVTSKEIFSLEFDNLIAV